MSYGVVSNPFGTTGAQWLVVDNGGSYPIAKAVAGTQGIAQSIADALNA